DLGILMALLRGFQQFRNGDGALAMCIAAAASAPWLVVFSLCVLGGRLNGIIAAGIPAHCLEGAGVEFLRLAVRFLLRLFFRLGRLLRSEEHTSELQSRFDLVCRLLLEK